MSRVIERLQRRMIRPLAADQNAGGTRGGWRSGDLAFKTIASTKPGTIG
ncbi:MULTISPECIES: hypothetical protein [unclassified Mesorhizobium]|nr:MULTISPECIES: hypothetical protein [unclassified Mesorhizobium]